MDTDEYNDNTQKFIMELYMNVLSNWDEIKENQQIVDCIDMKKNDLCQYFKFINPDQTDSQVQASALTIMFIVLLISIKYFDIVIESSNLIIEDID